jgi:hypothetical protein
MSKDIPREPIEDIPREPIEDIPREPIEENIEREELPIERESLDSYKSIGDGIYIDAKGKHFKLVDGVYLACFPSGYLKDQRTKTHICHYGRAFPSNPLSKEDDAALDAAIYKKMQECFPGSPYLDGKIPMVRKYSQKDIEKAKMKGD